MTPVQLQRILFFVVPRDLPWQQGAMTSIPWKGTTGQVEPPAKTVKLDHHPQVFE